MKNYLFSFFFLIFINNAFSAQVDTVLIYSPSMKKEIKTVVVTPENYNQQVSLPVIYLLHGHSGNHQYWVDRVPEIIKMVDSYNFILVCPDGEKSSWYWDSPVNPEFKYETFLSQELIKEIDTRYKTIPDRKGRAITGLSMGGHGALYAAFNHQDVFGAAGSMAGGVDIRAFPNNWDMVGLLGSYAENPGVWSKHTVIENVHLLKPNSLALFIDCGKDDFFYQVNLKLHEKLTYFNIPHTFMTSPGKHDVNYWGKTVMHQFLFFKSFFDSSSEL